MRLRSRIPALLAVLVFYPLATVAETGQPYFTGPRCFDWSESEGTCPAGDDALELLQASQDPADCTIISVGGSTASDSDECCYDVAMEACYDSADGCM